MLTYIKLKRDKQQLLLSVIRKNFSLVQFCFACFTLLSFVRNNINKIVHKSVFCIYNYSVAELRLLISCSLLERDKALCHGQKKHQYQLCISTCRVLNEHCASNAVVRISLESSLVRTRN